MSSAPTTLALVLSVLLLSGLATLAWRFRRQPGAKLFGLLQAVSAVWAALTVTGLQFAPGPVRLRLWGLSTGISLLVTALWLAFILSYTGRDSFLQPTRFGVVSLPLLVGTGLYVALPAWAPLTGTVEQTTIPVGTVVEASIGPIGAALGLYLYLVFLAGLAIVVKTILQSNSLFVGQAVALILGSLVTIVASMLTIVGVPMPGYPTTEVALTGQSLLWGYAVFGQQFLQIVPGVAAIGERAVFDDLDDGVIVVDTEGVVTRANPVARSSLDIDEVVGATVTPVLERMGVTTLADFPTRFRFRGRTYRATASAISNWRGDTVGQSLVIQDITPLVNRQQRLQVLTRILRHNVRNDMNVVLGLGSKLQEQDVDDQAAVGARINEKVDDLVTISEKAIEFDKLIDSPVTADPVDLQHVVSAVVTPIAARHEGATIETNVAADELVTDERLLSLVLEEAVSNAVEHSGAAPAVVIEVRRRDDHVAIAISDDGPGIPQNEIDPITAGEETALAHASSLGLWLLYWGARSLDGDLTITSTDEGSTVAISLPDMTDTQPSMHEAAHSGSIPE